MLSVHVYKDEWGTSIRYVFELENKETSCHDRYAVAVVVDESIIESCSMRNFKGESTSSDFLSSVLSKIQWSSVSSSIMHMLGLTIYMYMYVFSISTLFQTQ